MGSYFYSGNQSLMLPTRPGIFFHQIFIEHLQGTSSVPGTTDTNLNKTLSLQKKFDKFDHLKETLLKNISRDKSQIEIQITDKSKS